jgi:hypothetical protein
VELDTLYNVETWHAESLQEFVASGYLYQLNGLNDVATAIKNGNNDVAKQQLYDRYFKNLDKGIKLVFKPDATNPQHVDFYYKMQANAHKFAAYKSEYVASALQKAYEQKPNDYDKYSKVILQTANSHQITEYTTLINRNRTAKQFIGFKERADLFPNLEWLRTLSVTPRELHLHYVGIILPINDPFWQQNQPGNLYNCKCDWRQTNKPITVKPTSVVLPSKGLEGNPGTTREIFTEEHPYFSKATNEQKKRVDEFVSKQVFEKQFEKTQGGYFVHPLQDKKANDFNDLKTIAKHFASEKKEVFILPKLTESKGDLYKYMYKGAYEKKQPDLLIGGSFYEYESFVKPFTKRTLRDMISRGRKQSDRIIIDLRGTVFSHWYIRNRVIRLDDLKEVFGLTDNGIIRFK